MKTKISFFIIGVVLVTIIGCSNKQQNADELLKDQKVQDDIMTTISGNHEMMMNMMKHMMGNDHAMQMMTGNNEMMKMMTKGDHMMDMMGKDKDMMKEMMGHMMMISDKDSTMRKMMCESMMKDGKMMGMMKDMMKQKGMKMDGDDQQKQMKMDSDDEMMEKDDGTKKSTDDDMEHEDHH